MIYKSQTTSSINFEGLQMKLIRQKNHQTMPNIVSIFMASQCGIFLYKKIINLFSYI